MLSQTGSAVFLADSPFYEWWYPLLRPWVHYIPSEPDFSDLEQMVRYALDPKNAKQVRQIIRNGQRFCRTKLTMPQYTVDLLWTLTAYADLLAQSPDFYRTWRADPIAYRMEKQRMAPWRQPSTRAG